MAEPADSLWPALRDYRIGPEGTALTFTARLARENRWSEDYANRVVGEYKRFCWLALNAGHEVTPSDQIDQVWHLHLTYSRDYWQRFCPQVLGRDLHHGPTAGGATEGARYFEQYARTLKSYEDTFGPVPEDIWSPAAERFGEHPRAFRIRPSEVILFKDRGGIVRVMALAATLLAIGFVLGRFL